MNFSKTPDVNALVFDPFELRPGTIVEVTSHYVGVEEYTWDKAATFNAVISGVVYPTSIKADIEIDEDLIDVEVSGLYSTVTIEPFPSQLITGNLDLRIFAKREVTENIEAVSAINELRAAYFNDWFYDETGAAVPMTVLPLTLPENEMDYRLEDFDVTWSYPERGVSVLSNDVWRSNSAGTIKMQDSTDDFSFTRNMFRKGKKLLVVPMDCTIEPVVHYNTVNGDPRSKVVEIDLQDKAPEDIVCRGILWHRDKLYVLTSNGLYRFDRWGDFAEPEAHYPHITGNDLTYVVDDILAVTEDNCVRLYKMRHDFVNLDRQNDLVRMRERNPDMEIG